MLWRVMADIVVAVHAAYVAIVVIGFAAILIGSAAQWRWVRNFYFRAAHLAMILLVCAEALVGCPFTRLENVLRLRGGETGYTRTSDPPYRSLDMEPCWILASQVTRKLSMR
jgi:hypothetical protein